MPKNKKGKAATFPRLDASTATNEALLDEFVRVSDWMDWATTAAQNRHYEEYTGELKAEVLRRMSPQTEAGDFSPTGSTEVSPTMV